MFADAGGNRAGVTWRECDEGFDDSSVSVGDYVFNVGRRVVLLYVYFVAIGPCGVDVELRWRDECVAVEVVGEGGEDFFGCGRGLVDLCDGWAFDDSCVDAAAAIAGEVIVGKAEGEEDDDGECGQARASAGGAATLV